jgi:protein SPA2
MSFGHASDRSTRLAGGRVSAALNEDHERICRDYEFQIATMQTRIAGLEHELEDSDIHARQHEQSDQHVKQLEEELDKFRRVCSSC